MVGLLSDQVEPLEPLAQPIRNLVQFSAAGNVGELSELGLPIVLGASRKRFLGTLLGEDAEADRVMGSIACAVAAVLAGVHIVRAHDVRETVETLLVATAIRNASR